MKSYKNCIISILGDSISTFAGYIPVADGKNLAHRKRYPQDNLLTDVNETWWMRIINEQEARLGINDSWAGSTVGNVFDGKSGDMGEDAAMASMTRISNLGSNGAPDLILFYGGTNDIGRKLYPIGELSCDEMDAMIDEADLKRTKWDSLSAAYISALVRMKKLYPNAEILAILPGFVVSAYSPETLDNVNRQLIRICERLGVKYADLRSDGITPSNAKNYLPDKLHPNSEGMKLIAACVSKALEA